MQTPAGVAAPECECSRVHPWVVRCAHFEGGVVTFRDYGHPSYLEYYIDDEPQLRYGVFGCASASHDGPYFDGGETDDYDVALAAFHEAERWLLRGDE